MGGYGRFTGIQSRPGACAEPGAPHRFSGRGAGLRRAQILGDDTALGALPAVLERVVAAFGLRAALALQPSAGQPSAVLAAYPADAADPALLSALSMAQRGAPVELSSGPGGSSALLAYSKPADGQCLCALALAVVSVADLVTEAVGTAAPGAAKQGVTLEVSAWAGPPAQGDSRRLIQVLDNLIGNAVKFSHRAGVVRVSASCSQGVWRVDVADSGIGIPPEEADQLFSRFVRGSNARTAGLPGSGLGLSIVKVLTEMHGGHVEVSSALGVGSTFSVFWPAVAS